MTIFFVIFFSTIILCYPFVMNRIFVFFSFRFAHFYICQFGAFLIFLVFTGVVLSLRRMFFISSLVRISSFSCYLSSIGSSCSAWSVFFSSVVHKYFYKPVGFGFFYSFNLIEKKFRPVRVLFPFSSVWIFFLFWSVQFFLYLSSERFFFIHLLSSGF